MDTFLFFFFLFFLFLISGVSIKGSQVDSEVLVE